MKKATSIFINRAIENTALQTHELHDFLNIIREKAPGKMRSVRWLEMQKAPDAIMTCDLYFVFAESRSDDGKGFQLLWFPWRKTAPWEIVTHESSMPNFEMPTMSIRTWQVTAHTFSRMAAR